MDTSFLHGCAIDAVRYWERGRPVYNLPLACVVVLYFVLSGGDGKTRRFPELSAVPFRFMVGGAVAAVLTRSWALTAFWGLK